MIYIEMATLVITHVETFYLSPPHKY